MSSQNTPGIKVKIMIRTQNVSVAMSGGIDSAVSAFLLQQKGYSVSGATMKVCKHLLPDGTDTTLNDIKDAKEICDLLGIEHRVYNLENEFHDTVIHNFIESYLCGETPNPCVVCNNFLKFGKLLDLEVENGADYVATGHYANVEKDVNGRLLLKKAKDSKKDQTYMLYGLSQDQLKRVLFPLGNLEKSEIREIAAQNGFINANKDDSQDICFIPDGDYASFIEKELGYKYPEGNYIDENGNILGKHRGVIHYTVGQRKGLGISMNKHIFVIDKDFKCNTVTLADEDRLFKRRVVINGVNLIPFDSFDGKIRVEAKIRYSQNVAPAYAEITGENEITLEFDEPQRAPAKGQSAVLYDGDLVIGGGIIR